MNAEKALEYLKKPRRTASFFVMYLRCIFGGDRDLYDEFEEITTAALSRQIALPRIKVKVTHEIQSGYVYYSEEMRCPNPNCNNTDWDYVYEWCPYCGQHIDCISESKTIRESIKESWQRYV